ncbi:hypothetical protein Pelo_349 [Pelomyxa schiedti]|nr:hypothetical protein Pelo_349 [Pelomyxa schiedti]
MQLCVKGNGVPNLVVDVPNGDNTVDSLLLQIEEKTGKSMRYHKLLYIGHPLIRGHPLREYNIAEASTIHLVPNDPDEPIFPQEALNNKMYLCKKCQKVIKYPVVMHSAPGCCNAFCEKCTRLSDGNRWCAACKKVVLDNEIIADPASILDGLGRIEVVCNSCGAACLYRDWANHRCTVKCGFCSVEILNSELHAHYEQCPEYTIPCPLSPYCRENWKGARREASAHMITCQMPCIQQLVHELVLQKQINANLQELVMQLREQVKADALHVSKVREALAMDNDAQEAVKSQPTRLDTLANSLQPVPITPSRPAAPPSLISAPTSIGSPSSRSFQSALPAFPPVPSSFEPTTTPPPPPSRLVYRFQNREVRVVPLGVLSTVADCEAVAANHFPMLRWWNPKTHGDVVYLLNYVRNLDEDAWVVTKGVPTNPRNKTIGIFTINEEMVNPDNEPSLGCTSGELCAFRVKRPGWARPQNFTPSDRLYLALQSN